MKTSKAVYALVSILAGITGIILSLYYSLFNEYYLQASIMIAIFVLFLFFGIHNVYGMGKAFYYHGNVIAVLLTGFFYLVYFIPELSFDGFNGTVATTIITYFLVITSSLNLVAALAMIGDENDKR